MSLFYGNISGFISGPRIKMSKGILYSCSNLVVSVLTLFAFFKQVWVDPQADTIRMKRRIFWIFKSSWQVYFSDIRNIKYYCREIKANWSEYDEDYNAEDQYLVGLNLNDGRYKHLWTFAEGNGIQGSDSLEFVELLKFFTKKTLGPDHNRLRFPNQDWSPPWAK